MLYYMYITIVLYLIKIFERIPRELSGSWKKIIREDTVNYITTFQKKKLSFKHNCPIKY